MGVASRNSGHFFHTYEFQLAITCSRRPLISSSLNLCLKSDNKLSISTVNN